MKQVVLLSQRLAYKKPKSMGIMGVLNNEFKGDWKSWSVEWNQALEFKQNHIQKFVLVSTVIKHLVFEISYLLILIFSNHKNVNSSHQYKTVQEYNSSLDNISVDIQERPPKNLYNSSNWRPQKLTGYGENNASKILVSYFGNLENSFFKPKWKYIYSEEMILQSSNRFR